MKVQPFANDKKELLVSMTILASIVVTQDATSAATIVYEQDFENPAAFENNGGDVNIFTTVNQNYGNQPSGFTFAQAFSVETLLLTGSQAFGVGYSDPSGIGGNYALGMLSDRNDDRLGLSFNVGSNDFLNVRMDISSIDLSVFGGPFVSQGAEPIFEFTLFDNPSGVNGLGGGRVLSSLQATGTASPQTVFDWTEILLPLDASESTNGNVTLTIDLLDGGYASLDNFLIAASDTPGDLGEPQPEPEPEKIPEPSSLLGLLVSGSLGVISSLKANYKP